MLKFVIIYFSVYIHSVCLARMEKTEAMTFLKKYGYMPVDGKKPFQEAMKDFQNFMGLPETGKMDDKTDKMMRMPRCGFRDMDPEHPGQRIRRYAIHGSRWKPKQLTYKVVKYSKKIGRKTVNMELKESFDMWGKYINKTFVRKRTGDANILVGFYQDGSDFDGEGEILAYAFLPIFGGAVHFDESENWTSSSPNGTNFKNIALHEIGHSLGLEHSMNETAIMYPYYLGYKRDIKLQPDDVAGIQTLYSYLEKED